MKYNKKCTIVLLFKLLENESDSLHPISQSILAKLICDMGIHCDRKTVGRDIKALQGIGYPIKRCQSGYYMGRLAVSATEAKIVCQSLEEIKPEGLNLGEFIPRLKHAIGHKYI